MNKHAVDILLVEDDRRLADLTAEYFEQNGLSVAVESRGDQALSRFAKVKPRVVLLDLMLPGTDGLTICRELRETFDGPILIFTARDSDIDQIIGLEAGADDYVTKPVDPMVLLARTRALLRRVESFDKPAHSGGGKVDCQGRTKSTRPNHENTARLELLLPGDSHPGQHDGICAPDGGRVRSDEGRQARPFQRLGDTTEVSRPVVDDGDSGGGHDCGITARLSQ